MFSSFYKVLSKLITFCMSCFSGRIKHPSFLGLHLNLSTESPCFHMGHCFIGLLCGKCLLSCSDTENIKRTWLLRTLLSIQQSDDQPINPTPPTGRCAQLILHQPCTTLEPKQSQDFVWVKWNVGWCLLFAQELPQALSLMPRSFSYPWRCYASKGRAQTGGNLVHRQLHSLKASRLGRVSLRPAPFRFITLKHDEFHIFLNYFRL